MFWRARMTSGKAICLSDQFPAIDATRVMEGHLQFAGLPAVEIGRDVDWTANPHGNRSWALNLHALRWIGGLALAYERSGAPAYLRRACDLARHWIRENPRGGTGISPWAWAEHAVALRVPVLVCLSEHVRTRWLWDSLAEHGDVLADSRLYRAGHNHGLDQDIGLLVTGCRLGRARWRDLAVRRMTASAELAIDAQGVLHEQAPRYGVYVHRRLGVALRAIEESGVERPARLVAHRAALEAYVAHATQPDGRLVPIGDGPAVPAPGFAHDGLTVRVFDGGYVFGRTAWDDPRSAYYSIRFGPGQRLHGHEDHLGVTYNAQGRRILVEAGFHSYEKTGYVAWTRMPEAHNVPVVVTGNFRPGTATRLVSSAIEPVRQTYELADDAYGVTRTRWVLVNHGPDLMVVHDSVPAGSTLRSMWHFDPALKVVSRRDGVVVLGDGDWRVSLVQFPGAGQAVRPGLISPGGLRTEEVATVLSPEAAGVLTVIVPDCADPTVTASGSTVTVHTPGGPVTFDPSYGRSM
ncbi:hypothetical protein Misp01_47570 [Microtetraspora sp. NBRC 13810]|nr:hypothetical protein Misp01_47570 [Microtetraspora sp. NBRC 13810]